MRKAVEQVLSNKMSARQAADRYQVPRTTLNDRINAIKKDKEEVFNPVMGSKSRGHSGDLDTLFCLASVREKSRIFYCLYLFTFHKSLEANILAANVLETTEPLYKGSRLCFKQHNNTARQSV